MVELHGSLGKSFLNMPLRRFVAQPNMRYHIHAAFFLMLEEHRGERVSSVESERLRASTRSRHREECISPTEDEGLCTSTLGRHRGEYVSPSEDEGLRASTLCGLRLWGMHLPDRMRPDDVEEGCR